MYVNGTVYIEGLVYVYHTVYINSTVYVDSIVYTDSTVYVESTVLQCCIKMTILIILFVCLFCKKSKWHFEVEWLVASLDTLKFLNPPNISHFIAFLIAENYI